MFNATSDIMEKVRRTMIPPFGAVIQFINEAGDLDLYVKGDTDRTEFVGRVEMSEERFEKVLRSMGFTRNPLASLKRLASTKESEEGSFRFVSDDSDRQLHVIIYDGKDIPDADTGYTYIYAHDEYRWDWYPIKHYLGKDMDEQMGVNRMRNLLRAQQIPFDDDRPSS